MGTWSDTGFWKKQMEVELAKLRHDKMMQTDKVYAELVAELSKLGRSKEDLKNRDEILRRMKKRTRNAGLYEYEAMVNLQLDLGLSDADMSFHEELMKTDSEYQVLFNKYKDAQTAEERKQLYKQINKFLSQKKSTFQNLAKEKFKKAGGSRDKLIATGYTLVYALAKKFLANSNERVDIKDLIQAGNLGLVLAADVYLSTPFLSGGRPKFTTVAYMWIRKYIKEESIRQGSLLSATLRDKYKIITTNADTAGNRTDSEGEEFPNDIWDVKMDKVAANNAFSELKIVEDEVYKLKQLAKTMLKDLSKYEKKVFFLFFGIDTPEGKIYNKAEISRLVGKSKAQLGRDVENMLWKIKRNASGLMHVDDIISTFCLIHGVDLSLVPEFSMQSTD